MVDRRAGERWYDSGGFLAGVMLGCFIIGMITFAFIEFYLLPQFPAPAARYRDRLEIVRADQADRKRVRCYKGLELTTAGKLQGGESVWIVPAAIPAGDYFARCL